MGIAPPSLQTILSRVTQEGMRPEFPPHSPASYVTLAQRCWDADPVARPTFGDIMVELKAMQDEGIRLPDIAGPIYPPPSVSSGLLGRSGGPGKAQ